MLDDKYYRTISKAMKADTLKFKTAIDVRPWHHALICKLEAIGKDGSTRQRDMLVLYVWDTREIVDAIDITDNPYDGGELAVDNDAKLVDPKRMLPLWLNDLTKHKPAKFASPNFRHR